ncbi:putative antigen 43 precursor [Escherichia coli]|uniref:Putative antigen 43 n=1 Tax=Escherichia coli TaxID=562 RepID=A0A376LG79_ECOLX|nr:putative antigen 43 precursor [Escherichia coli]
MLEPQLQYTWQGLSLDDGQDNAGYVKFGHGSAQHVRAGFRLGSHNDMTFGEGTSSRDTLRDSTKHRVRELPVNWWVQPSVIRTFSSRGDMSMGTAAAGSNMTFSPSRNGTSTGPAGRTGSPCPGKYHPGRSGRLCPQRQRQQR